MTNNLTTNLNNMFRSTKTEIENIKAIMNAINTLSLPSQTGHAGEFLKTDGTNASWGKVPMPDSYCFVSGKVNANGEADLLDITDTSKVVFNVDNNNPLVGALADGTEFTRTSLADLDCSQLADGDYNLFVGESGACIPLANTIFRHKADVRYYQNYSVVGSPTILDYTISDLSASDYVKTLESFDFSNPFEIKVKFNTGNLSGNSNTSAIISQSVYDANARRLYLALYNNKLSLCIGTGSSSWSIANGENGTFTFADNTDYYVKFKWTGSTYTVDYSTDDDSYTNDITVNSSSNIGSFAVCFGCYGGDRHPFTTGTIYLKDSYIDVNSSRAWDVLLAQTNDVWVDTSTKPYKSYKYDGTDWQEFKYVDLPQSITVASGVVTAVNKSGGFNENGYDIGRETLTHNAFPNKKYDELTLGASGSTYIAPADGWFFAAVRVANTNAAYMHFDNKTVQIGSTCNAYNITSNYMMKCVLPVSKGDNVKLSYTNSNTGNIYFIYANGEV